jgi:hypothetical protein
MAPFNWFQSSGMTEAQRTAATGGPLRSELLTLDSMRAALRTFGRDFAPRELAVMQFRGEPHWIAERAPSAADAAQWMEIGLLPRAALPRLERRYVSVTQPAHGSFTHFDREAIPAIARAAMPGVAVQDEAWLQDYDGYYYDPRSSRSLPVFRVRYADADETWLYLDPARGGIVQRSDRVTRLRRWLYQGFHSLDFPFLYFQRPLWDIVVILLSLGGLISGITTLTPAWRRLRRHAAKLGRAA